MLRPSTTNTELDKLIANHAKNMNLQFMTKAVFVNLDHLKTFIAQVEDRHNRTTAPGYDPQKVCDSIKICFVRFEFKTNRNQILPAGKDQKGIELTQTSLIFVPVKSDPKTWTSVHLTN